MTKIISFTTASKSVIIINIMVILFHLTILTGLIPYENVWAGKLKSHEDMIVFESISIMVNLIFISLVILKSRSKKILLPKKIIQFGLWIFVIIFSLNTIGNLFAVSIWEKLIATPLTFILALLTCRIAIEKNYNDA